MSELLTQLKAIVGPSGFREGNDIDEKHYRDLMGARKNCPRLHLRPDNTAQIAQILALCNSAKQPIAPQGGMTGLVSGAAPMENEITLGLERMNKIIEIDPFSATMTVEAGTPLQTIQEAADKHGLLFPLDLGARGSCSIGGNLSTNAGGNRVIRYGMTRDLVIGLEAVTADGSVLNSLNKLRKNNTGYDLKQLFMGSEGTLGVITKVVLKLFPKPSSQTVAFCALENFAEVKNLLVHLQANLGGNLTAFEALWANTYKLIHTHGKLQLPFAPEHAFYVLVESMGNAAEKDSEVFAATLESAVEKGIILDAVISHSEKDVQNLWAIRDGASEVPRSLGRMHAYDVSLAINDMDDFGNRVVSTITARWPSAEISIFGHLGDGNLHVLVHVGENNKEHHHAIDDIIYGLVGNLQGSISAEHGIGTMKREYLSLSRGAADIALMKTLKRAMDPNNILNPGRIFEMGL